MIERKITCPVLVNPVAALTTGQINFTYFVKNPASLLQTSLLLTCFFKCQMYTILVTKISKPEILNPGCILV